MVHFRQSLQAIVKILNYFINQPFTSWSAQYAIQTINLNIIVAQIIFENCIKIILTDLQVQLESTRSCTCTFRYCACVFRYDLYYECYDIKLSGLSQIHPLVKGHP